MTSRPALKGEGCGVTIELEGVAKKHYANERQRCLVRLADSKGRVQYMRLAIVLPNQYSICIVYIGMSIQRQDGLPTLIDVWRESIHSQYLVSKARTVFTKKD